MPFSRSRPSLSFVRDLSFFVRVTPVCRIHLVEQASLCGAETKPAVDINDRFRFEHELKSYITIFASSSRFDEYTTSDMTGVTLAPSLSKGPLAALMGKSVYPHEWYAALQKCQTNMPEFFGRYLEGHPRPLFEASEDIMTILWQIQHFDAWQEFRDQIAKTVSKMDKVSTMICLGLGKYCGTVEPTNAWVVQYAVFVYIWEKVNKKWQDDCKARHEPVTFVKRIFQDPEIDKRTIYLLQKIARDTDIGTNVVVEHPEALRQIEDYKNILVYAPHVPSRLSIAVLDQRPQVYIGNSSSGHGGWSTGMIEEYMEECKFDGIDTTGPKVTDLLDKTRVARHVYGEEALNNVGPVDKSHLAGISIFQRHV
jgi:hypothetical protein